MSSSAFRRFTLPAAPNVHDLLPPRIRTWSDSVVHNDRLDEVDGWELEKAEANRRCSLNSSHQDHVTDFLASQTLALFLNFTQPTPSHESRPSPRSSLCSRLPSFEDAGAVVNPNSSDLSSSSSPVQWRRLSERFGGANLTVVMASAGEPLRRSNTATNNKSDDVSSVAQLSLPDELRDSSSRPPTPSPRVKDSVERRSYQLKKFSQSTPALQLHYDLNNLGRSKSRQKKFLRLFPGVSRDERVLNYYSCALVGDLLLQGHLYVTYNYFAFHSNVFGYVTKLLIPVSDVKKVTKEKTAKFIPNAIGISTLAEKHLFSSLMSRDVTYRLAMSVWKKFHFPNRMDLLDCGEAERENEGSSQNGEQSSNESFSHHSAEGLIRGLSRPASVLVTSVTEGTSTDMDENDSAIEHSYSPTPDREETDNRVSALDQLNAASSVLATARSNSYFFNFLSSRSSNNREDCDDVDGHPSMDSSDDTSHERNSNWAYMGICFLLVMLCLSACILWYRMYVLHSNLEHRLTPMYSSEVDPLKLWSHSFYSPQMQELVDSLNLLLSSHTSNEDTRNEKEPTPLQSR